jgi:hypothetical protein
MSIPVPYVAETAVEKYESPEPECNIYPYTNLHWVNYVDRFKFKVPEIFITKAEGISICNSCKQVYVGYQERCIKLRYMYKIGWGDHYQKGHMLIGETDGYSTVRESGLFPCNEYCKWDKADGFYKQQNAFNEFEHVISKICNFYVSTNLEMDVNDAEKWNLIMQIDNLMYENNNIKLALKEIVNRLNAGGAGLMGGINF